MLEWLRDQPPLLWTVMGLVSVVTFVGTLILVPILVARMPADYFRYKRPRAVGWSAQHPFARLLVLGLKNLAGIVFLVMGVAMLVLPGQGILTILMGLMLLSFPGKRRFELFLIQRPFVARSMGWIRRKAKRPPLLLPNEGADEGGLEESGREGRSD